MAQSPTAFAERGPHPVGVATVQLTDPSNADRKLDTDVWYPAVETRGEPASHPLNRPHEAIESAAPASGAFPLIAFSHGNSGLRRQSTFLTTHLASWGFVVAAPDHTGNTFFEMAQIQSEEERQQVHFEARRNRPSDLGAVIDTVVGADGAWAEVDTERIGVMGHSYGGWTATKMPGRDPRVSAVCGLAPVSEPFVGRKAYAPGELPFDPAIPVLFIAGIDDVLVDLQTSVRPLFERMAGSRALVGVEKSDHFHFCDGVELLHGMHHKNPRPDQPRPTKPYGEQLPEDRVHRALRAVVTCFFQRALADRTADPCADLAREALAEIDPALRRIDSTKAR